MQSVRDHSLKSAVRFHLKTHEIAIQGQKLLFFFKRVEEKQKIIVKNSQIIDHYKLVTKPLGTFRT